MIEAFTTGFYNQLKGNTNLQTKLSGSSGDKKIYNTLAPQSATLPYLTYGLLTDSPIGTFEDLAIIEDMTFYINAFDTTGVENLLEIVDLIKTAMDDATLTITGYTPMICMREFVGNVLFDTDKKVYQIPMRYRVRASK